MQQQVVDAVTAILTHEYDGERKLPSPQHVDVQITETLARAFARAAFINVNDPFQLSFTSLLAALVIADDDFSRWLQQHLESYGATPDAIANRRERSVSPARLQPIALSPTMPFRASKSGYEAIAEARAIAAATGATVVDARHVAAAYPILSNWHVQDFAELAIDRLAWCRALAAYMAKHYPSEQQYWRDYADRASPVPLTSFSADVYTEHDLLGIDRSVDALALLIASTRTDTPLSIGVFGPWGSGKSFFMRHLRHRIYSLAGREQKRVAAWVEARRTGKARPEDAPLYYGQVAQVEFNAWHYNEGNLVASLVDHLFRNLRVLPDKSDAELERRRAEVIATISEAEGAALESTAALEQTQQTVRLAESAVQRATDEAASARRDVDAKAQELDDSASEAARARQQLDIAIQNLSTASDDVDPAAAAAVAATPLLESTVVAEARSAADAFVRELQDWRGFTKRLLTARGLVVIALCLAVPAILWLVERLTAEWASLSAVAAIVAANCAPALKVIRERREAFEAKLQELEREEARRREQRRVALEREVADLQARSKARIDDLRVTLERERAALAHREAAVAAAVRELADRTKELDKKVAERAAAEATLRDATAQLKRLSSALLLDEFIKERSGSDEYRKGLSLLALVRRDFERLSDLIAAANEDWCAHDKNSAPPLLNRIVLYIDDLDRCNVDTVMKVLEAVHLLLAFPLFVCVVAVDPRWIEKCLREKHAQLFIDEGAPVAHAGGDRAGARVTVGDYLEKIFQIPIWMSPIDSRQRAAVVKALLGATAAPLPKAAPRSDGRETKTERHEGPEGGHGQPDNGFKAIVAKAAETPDPLRITAEESSFVERVGPLLSEKPRALKRFVNTYRLLKASLSDLDRQSFVSNEASSPYKVCISQLALFTGHPRLAPLLVREVTRSNGAAPTVSQWLHGLPARERTALEKAVSEIPDNAALQLTEFRRWIPETSKYLFHRDG